jgi:hypothetical protein
VSRCPLIAVGLLLTGVSGANGQANVRVKGAHVAVLRGATELPGELIAVGPDSVWLLVDTGLVAVPRLEIDGVKLQRKALGAGGIAIWGALGATVTGLALTAACSTLQGGSCGPVLPGTFIAWLLPTGIAAAAAGSRDETLHELDRLTAFARFPQGLPPGLDRSSLVPQSREAAAR